MHEELLQYKPYDANSSFFLANKYAFNAAALKV